MPISEEQSLRSSFHRNEACVMGLPFDLVDEQQALELIDGSIRDEKQCFLSTPNLNFAISALSDNDFRESVFRSDLSVADGMPLIWVSKLIGAGLPERVAGSSLFDLIRRREVGNKVSVFFFGGMDAVAEIAAGELTSSSSGAYSVGSLNPGVGTVEQMSADSIINAINDAEPDFLVVSLGAKKGQKWILRNQDRLNANVLSHLGAVVNFVAGTLKRAPIIWQKLGLEWVWRITEEPGLWNRYFFDGLSFACLVVTRVFPLAICGKLLEKRYRTLGLNYSHLEEEGATKINLSGCAVQSNLTPLKDSLPLLVMGCDEVKVDLQGLEYADCAFWALLLRLRTELSARGKALSVRRASKRLAYLSRLNMVGDLLDT